MSFTIGDFRFTILNLCGECGRFVNRKSTIVNFHGSHRTISEGRRDFLRESGGRGIVPPARGRFWLAVVRPQGHAAQRHPDAGAGRCPPKSSPSASITPTTRARRASELPKEPLIWFKATTSLLPDGGKIEIPFPQHRTDFEAELAIVIGRKIRNVSPTQASRYIFGYTAAQDISDRTIQKADGQWARCEIVRHLHAARPARGDED